MKKYALALTEEMRKKLSKLDELATASGTVSKPALREQLKALHSAVMGVCSNLPFHVEQHKEMMEKNVQAAKSDVEGYITGIATTLGLDALRKMASQLEYDKTRNSVENEER